MDEYGEEEMAYPGNIDEETDLVCSSGFGHTHCENQATPVYHPPTFCGLFRVNYAQCPAP